MGRPLLAPGASTSSAMRPGRNGGSGCHQGRWCLSNSLPMVEGVGSNGGVRPPLSFLGRSKDASSSLGAGSESHAAMTVPRLVISAATMTPNALI
jgi:hypothetical protein